METSRLGTGQASAITYIY